MKSRACLVFSLGLPVVMLAAGSSRTSAQKPVGGMLPERVFFAQPSDGPGPPQGGMTAEQMRQVKESKARAVELRRQVIERRTVDAVIVNEPASERDHAFEGDGATEGSVQGRRWRAAGRGGWFSYQLKATDKPLMLVCTYIGAAPAQPMFDILVDGEKIASVLLRDRPEATWDAEYLIPEKLTRNKERLTVRFQAQRGSSTGAILDVRTVWADVQE
jgi:hypothetical protein